MADAVNIFSKEPISEETKKTQEGIVKVIESALELAKEGRFDSIICFAIGSDDNECFTFHAGSVFEDPYSHIGMLETFKAEIVNSAIPEKYENEIS